MANAWGVARENGGPPPSLHVQVRLWLEEQGEMPDDRRQALLEPWEGFAQEPDAVHFARLLRGLPETKEFMHSDTSRKALGQRVVDVLDVLARDAELRDRCFITAEEGVTTCSDRIAVAFSNVETAVRAVSLVGQHAELLELAKGIHRVALLDQFAAQDIKQRYAEKDLTMPEAIAAATAAAAAAGEEVLVEEVEIVLAYHVKLAKPLDLPGQPERMNFMTLAKVSEEQLAQATAFVLATEKCGFAARIASIAGQPFWQASLAAQPACAEAIAQLDEQRGLETDAMDAWDAPLRAKATQEERDSDDSDYTLNRESRWGVIMRNYNEGVKSVHRQFTRIAMDRVEAGLAPIDVALGLPRHVVAAAKVSDIAVQLQGLLMKEQTAEAAILARQLLEPELLAALHPALPPEVRMGKKEAEAMDTVNVQYMELLRILATEEKKVLDDVAFDRLRGGDTHPTEEEAPYLLYIASRAGTGVQDMPAAAPRLAHAAVELIKALAVGRALGSGQKLDDVLAEMRLDLLKSNHPAQTQGPDGNHNDFFVRVLMSGSPGAPGEGALCAARELDAAGLLPLSKHPGAPSLTSAQLAEFKKVRAEAGKLLSPSDSKTVLHRTKALDKVVHELGEVNVAAAQAKHAHRHGEWLAMQAASKPMENARQSIYSAVYSAVDALWAKGTQGVRNAHAPNPLAFLVDSDDAAAHANASRSKSLSRTAPGDVTHRVLDSLLATPQGQVVLKQLAGERKLYKGRQHREFEQMLQDRVREHVLPMLGKVGSALHSEATATAAVSRALDEARSVERQRVARAQENEQTGMVQFRAADTGTPAGGLAPPWAAGLSVGRTGPGNVVPTAAIAQGAGQAASQGAGRDSAEQQSAELLLMPPAPSGPVGGAERRPAGPTPSHR